MIDKGSTPIRGGPLLVISLERVLGHTAVGWVGQSVEPALGVRGSPRILFGNGREAVSDAGNVVLLRAS
jgi:hypothetical protein